MTEKTNIVNINIPNSNYYYRDKFNENWINEPQQYAMAIAMENHFSEVLSLPMDRIIYASNDYTFRERERKNNGSLNIPYMSYYFVGYSECEREWFNNWANTRYPMTHDNQMVTLGQKIKLFPVRMEYEAVAFFSQHKDCEYAYKMLAYDASNETIIYPTMITPNGDTLKGIGILNYDLEFNPSYNENDWLERNKIYSIGMNFSLDTFQVIGDLSKFSIAKSVVWDFISAKKLNKEDLSKSEEMIVLSQYFNPTEGE